MQQHYTTPFIDWPKIDFEEIEHTDIENKLARDFYRSFFVVLRLPKKMIVAFIIVLKQNPQ